jgi:hypothetical protein
LAGGIGVSAKSQSRVDEAWSLFEYAQRNYFKFFRVDCLLLFSVARSLKRASGLEWRKIDPIMTKLFPRWSEYRENLWPAVAWAYRIRQAIESKYGPGECNHIRFQEAWDRTLTVEALNAYIPTLTQELVEYFRCVDYTASW